MKPARKIRMPLVRLVTFVAMLAIILATIGISAYLRDLTAQIRFGSNSIGAEHLRLGYATLHEISLISLALQLPLEDEAVAAISATKFEDLIEGLTVQGLALRSLQGSISKPAT